MSKTQQTQKKVQHRNDNAVARTPAGTAATPNIPPPPRNGEGKDRTRDDRSAAAPADPHHLHRMILEAHRQADLQEVAEEEAEAVPWDSPAGS